MHAVVRKVVAVAARAKHISVFLRRFAGPFLERLRKIPIVGKSRIHTDSNELVVRVDHALAGVVEADCRHVFLKALVQCLADKAGQSVH